MGKPNYRVIVSFDRERSTYSARAPELEHLSGDGATRAAAIAALEVEIDAQLANMLSLGTTPPRAVDDTEFSGELACKVSRALHRDLSLLARSDGIEVDQLVSELLAAALTSRQGARGGRDGGRPRPAPLDGGDDIGNRVDGPAHGGNRQGGARAFARGFNSQLTDDRANFIEYVRGLEHGNHNGNHRPHGGGGGGGGGRGDHGGHGGGQGGRRRRGGGGGGGGRGPGGPGGPGRDGNRMHGHHPGGGGGGGHPGGGVGPGANPPPRPALAAPPSAPSDPDGHEG